MVFKAKRVGRVLIRNSRNESVLKESDNVVNQSHWNTAKTRERAQDIILSRQPHRRCWVPVGSSLELNGPDLDYVPFFVGVNDDSDELLIRSVLVIRPPNKFTTNSATI